MYLYVEAFFILCFVSSYIPLPKSISNKNSTLAQIYSNITTLFTTQSRVLMWSASFPHQSTWTNVHLPTYIFTMITATTQPNLSWTSVVCTCHSDKMTGSYVSRLAYWLALGAWAAASITEFFRIIWVPLSLWSVRLYVLLSFYSYWWSCKINSNFMRWKKSL